MNTPPDYLPPDAPATVEDVRAARRWTWVAFAWAIAASVVAVIALVQANNNKSSDTQQSSNAADVTAQIKAFENQTNDQLDQFNKRLSDTATAADLDKIDKRLTQVEDDLAKLKTKSSDQADAVTKLQTDLDALTKRVDALEQQQGSGQAGGGTQTTP